MLSVFYVLLTICVSSKNVCLPLTVWMLVLRHQLYFPCGGISGLTYLLVFEVNVSLCQPRPDAVLDPK